MHCYFEESVELEWLFGEHSVDEVVAHFDAHTDVMMALALLADRSPDDACETLRAHVAFPMSEFVLASAFARIGDRGRAIECLRRVSDDCTCESRYVAWAWAAIRQLGVEPDVVSARRMLGVVFEVSFTGRIEALAGYDDGLMLFVSGTGFSEVFDAAFEEGVGVLIDGWFDDTQDLLGRPSTVGRDPLPRGWARLTVITPLGMHSETIDLATMIQEARVLAHPRARVMSTALSLLERIHRASDDVYRALN